MARGDLSRPRVAEFFAGAGLVGMALEQEGCEVVFANDYAEVKRNLYAANLDASHYVLSDIRDLDAADVPSVNIATASFPCTDLSLAGGREGLEGKESGIIWHFVRILDEMDGRRPPVVMLENVPGFLTSNGGRDLRDTIAALNDMGYICDVLALDARRFVAQSRLRVFVVASLLPLGSSGDWTPDEHRLKQVARFVEQHPGLNLQAARLPALPDHHDTLTNVVESLPPNDQRWWDAQRRSAFLGSLSGIQDDRLQLLRQSERVRHAAAYRRTRHGKAVWEIRSDEISGCLRTARGGSSRQALVEAGRGEVRVRWMTAREYARLQGAPSFEFGDASENQAKFAMGDAVCVPAVAWLARNYLVPLAQGSLSSNPRRQTLAHA